MSHDPDPRLVERLRAAGCVWAEDEARLLEAASSDPDQREALVRRRTAGEPLELVLGWADLDGARVRVAAGVFVPRTRSALLVRRGAALLPPGGVAVDLGCGTGALGAALLVRRPDAEVWAVDLDPSAVACARTNLAPGRVVEGDLWAALPARLRGRVDVALVNAPYVPSEEIALMATDARDHEHRVALDGGPDGLDVQRRVASGLEEWLAPGGAVVLETSEHQADTSAAILRSALATAPGWVVVTERDDDLDATVVLGRLGT